MTRIVTRKDAENLALSLRGSRRSNLALRHGVVIANGVKQSYLMPDAKRGYVYITTNPSNEVLYTGVTSDLVGRVYQHKQKLIDGFTKRYNATKFVYYEIFDTIADAIVREKQIKGGSRKKKIDLIAAHNPSWRDLADEL